MSLQDSTGVMVVMVTYTVIPKVSKLITFETFS